MPQLLELSVIMSNYCNIDCQHCFLSKSDRQNKDKLPASKLQQYLTAIKDELPRTILIYGGEPFLYQNHLDNLIKVIKPFNIPIKIITNGFWGHEIKHATDVIEQCQTWDLKHLVLSVDYFHQNHVSLSKITNILEAARQRNFKRIAIAHVTVPKNIDQGYNQRTQSLLQQLKPYNDVIIDYYNFNLLLIGEAVNLIPDTYKVPPLLNQTCDSKKCYGDSFYNVDSIDLYPNGDLVFCAGIRIGNANNQSINEIIKNFCPSNYKFMDIIANQGTDKLHEILKQAQPSTQNFVDICHACSYSRKQLKEKFPDELF